jgi:peptidoglycan/LPS O-acetylase OafA/YrhL
MGGNAVSSVDPSSQAAEAPFAPETSERTASKKTRFPGFDGLRAIAAISVLAFHASTASTFDSHSSYWIYARRLNIGVAVFFLISGFLLYRPFAVSHLEMKESPSTPKFWFRRLLRIVPAYWLALTFITYWLHAARPGRGWAGVLAVYGFAQIYFPSQALSGLPQAWTLCVEMSFYLALPLYAGVIAFRRSSPHRQLVRELAGLGVLTVFGYLFRLWALSPCPKSQYFACISHPPMREYTRSWLPSYVIWFALGMSLAVISAWVARTERRRLWFDHRWFPWASWIGAAAVFYWIAHLGIANTAFATMSVGLNTLYITLSGFFAFLLLLPAVFGPQDQGLIRRFLSCWPIASLGVISYGIYLWHAAWVDQCLKWFGNTQWGTVPGLGALVLMVLALSIASASVSYFGLERPILHFKDTVARWRRWTMWENPRRSSV